MKLYARSVYLLGVCAFLALAGCQKKVTKVDTPPPPPPPVEEPAPPPPEPPAPVIDYDALARENLATIYFEFDRSNLTSESIAKLERAAKFLQQYPNLRFMVEGHADERGSAEYNMGLGENRAKSVKNYLAGYGIDGSRLDVTSYGKERPASPNCSDESCHSQNRRAEWRMTAR